MLFRVDCICMSKRHGDEMNPVQQIIGSLQKGPLIIRALSDHLLSNIINNNIDIGQEDLKRLVLLRALARAHCLDLKCAVKQTNKYDNCSNDQESNE